MKPELTGAAARSQASDCDETDAARRMADQWAACGRGFALARGATGGALTAAAGALAAAGWGGAGGEFI